MSLDDLITDNYNSDTIGDMLIDDDVNIEEDLVEKEFNIYLKEEITKMLNDLDEMDKKIIMLYFGFYDGKIYRQKEISELLGISQPHVSRRLSKLLKIFKIKIESLEEYNDVNVKLLTKRVA